MTEILMTKAIASSIPVLIKVIRKYRNKKRESKKERENSQYEFVVLNLSGHPLSPKAKSVIATWGNNRIIEKEVPSINLTNGDTYMENVVSFVANMVKELIEKERIVDFLLQGRFVLIPSGMASLNDVQIAMLHGIAGHFPKVAYTYKSNFGFTLTDHYDLQELRTSFRDMR